MSQRALAGLRGWDPMRLLVQQQAPKLVLREIAVAGRRNWVGTQGCLAMALPVPMGPMPGPAQYPLHAGAEWLRQAGCLRSNGQQALSCIAFPVASWGRALAAGMVEQVHWRELEGHEQPVWAGAQAPLVAHQVRALAPLHHHCWDRNRCLRQFASRCCLAELLACACATGQQQWLGIVQQHHHWQWS